MVGHHILARHGVLGGYDWRVRTMWFSRGIDTRLFALGISLDSHLSDLTFSHRETHLLYARYRLIPTAPSISLGCTVVYQEEFTHIPVRPNPVLPTIARLVLPICDAV